jgi:hypothetical protein
MSTEPQKTQRPDPGQADWLLQMLVDMVNNNADMELPITLHVEGLLVSGNLVGGVKYFEGFATDFAESFATNPEISKGIRESVSKFGEIYKATGKEDADGPLPTYIHLKQARFFNTSGMPIPANKGVWWRGRLSEVSGFILGSLSADRG